MRMGPALGMLVVGVALARADPPCVEVEVLQALEHEKVVILGEVLSSTPSDDKGRPVESAQAVQALYQVRVVEEFKGAGVKQYALLGDLRPTPSPSGLAQPEQGFRLTVGEKYLLFAWGEPLQIDPCTPTAPLREAEKALLLLRQHTHGVKGTDGQAALAPRGRVLPGRSQVVLEATRSGTSTCE